MNKLHIIAIASLLQLVSSLQAFNYQTFVQEKGSSTIFEVKFGKTTKELNHESAISEAIIIASEMIAITISANKAIIWDLRTGKELKTLRPNESTSILPQSMTPNIKIIFTENNEVKIEEDF